MKLKTFVQNGIRMVVVSGMLVMAGCGENSQTQEIRENRQELGKQIDNEHEFAVAMLSSRCTGICKKGGYQYYDENVAKYGPKKTRTMAVDFVNREYHF